MHAIPPHRLRHAVAFEVPASSKTGVGDHLCNVALAREPPDRPNKVLISYDAWSPATIVPSNGITENEYWSYILRCALSEMIGSRVEGSTYCASAGFVTLLNSRQANVPPRCASRSTAAIEGNAPDPKMRSCRHHICVVRESFNGQFLSVTVAYRNAICGAVCSGLTVRQHEENREKRAYCCGTPSF